MATDPRKLKAAELLRLVNSTPLGEVISSSSFYRLRQRAGLNVSDDGKTMHLLKFTRWLIGQVPAPAAGERSAPSAPGQSHRDRMAAASRRRTSSVSDIGEIPPIADPKRRESCRSDLAKFCRTYNPDVFYMGWADYHRDAIARLQETILQGTMFAFAMPRSGGKTTLCRMAVLWAVSYAYRRYVFYIGSTNPKGEKGLDAVKTFMRFLPLYVDDFPEIAVPIRALEGRPQRAASQHCRGEPTLISWGKDSIVLPTVPPPPNLDIDDDLAPTSGTVIGASGLTAEGIRGSLHTTRTGEQLRPDFVILDDPQTDESARSDDQNTKRLELIHGAVLGMAGPGKSIAAAMPCTVIAPGDMVDQTLDRSQHPLWRGSRTQMLEGWPEEGLPENIEAWEPYFDIYDHCVHLEPPDFTEANVYYRKHRKQLDGKLEATWPDRKEWEVSAVQHAMNLFHRDPMVFMAEYMNRPVDPHADERPLDAEDLLKRRNGYDRGKAPIDVETVTAYIDVQGELLYWLVAGWGEGFGGHVLDYGTWPRQSRRRFTLADANQTLSKAYPGKELGGRLYAGLEDLTDELMGNTFRRDDGADLSIERCLIDANWGQSTDVVYQFCRQSPHAARLTPGHGKYYGAKGKGIHETKKQKGERIGLHWRMPSVRGRRQCRYVIIDTNFWKSFVAERLKVGEGDRGAIQFFGSRGQADARTHDTLVEQLTAERCVKVTANDRTVDEWTSPPKGRDNHWWDCLVGSAVAASMSGVNVREHRSTRPTTKRRRRKSVSITKAQTGR